MSKTITAIQDQLGLDPEQFVFLNANPKEYLGLEIPAIKIKTREIGNSIVVGHPINGKVGPATAINGLPLVVGPANNDEELLRVVSPNNTFIERVRFDDFYDDGSSSAVTFDTTEHKITIQPNGYLVSETIAKRGTGNISEAKISVEGSGTAKYYLSGDGVNFEEVELDDYNNLIHAGDNLKYKIEASSTAEITMIKIEYRWEYGKFKFII